ncbi:hypothetical protein HS088_TW13G00452 [Tripterygium wilfordii]|uniref:Uncharacterized protein n=1 Tax=Tripterygium wilfordii TaxID=458696 RepID=A0A7J7CU02_TRIWF|nr:hypothetical protein HS088_TW13G00452 [Tripterygium wilfordii]
MIAPDFSLSSASLNAAFRRLLSYCVIFFFCQHKIHSLGRQRLENTYLGEEMDISFQDNGKNDKNKANSGKSPCGPVFKRREKTDGSPAAKINLSGVLCILFIR